MRNCDVAEAVPKFLTGKSLSPSNSECKVTSMTVIHACIDRLTPVIRASGVDNRYAGPNTGDITHYFIGEWTYQVPGLPGVNNRAARLILGGWQVSGILLARTGIPVQLSQTGTGLNVSRPDYIGGQPILDDYTKSLKYLNPAAFALVPINPVSRITVRPGNVGNNDFREPGPGT